MATTAANPTMIRVPMMASFTPPPGTPWGTGSWVKKASESPLTPRSMV